MCEYPDFFSESHPVAKRDHECSECHGVIKSGEAYWAVVGSWSHEVSRYKICAECEEMRGEYESHRRPQDDPLPFGYLLEYLVEGDERDMLWDFFYTAQKRTSRWLDSIAKRVTKRWQVVWRVRYGQSPSHVWRIVPTRVYENEDLLLHDLIRSTINQIPGDLDQPLNAIELLNVKCEKP